MDRFTVEEAARILGIKEESVRKRVSRGKLRADKDEDGRLLVYVDSTETVRDEYTDKSLPESQVEAELRDRIAYLERQVEEEREARRRADTLLAKFMDSLPALEAAQEPSQESSEAPQDAAEGRVGVGVGQADAAPPAPSSRPWWRRMFGG